MRGTPSISALWDSKIGMKAPTATKKSRGWRFKYRVDEKMIEGFALTRLDYKRDLGVRQRSYNLHTRQLERGTWTGDEGRQDSAPPQ